MSARSVSRLWTNGGQYTAAAQATGDYPGTTGYIVDARPTTMTAGESTDTFSDSVGPSLTMPTAATDGAENNDATGSAIGNPGQYVYSMAKLNQPIYILPGQTFQNKFIPLSGVSGSTVTGGEGTYTPGDSVVSFTTFSVYDGPDALIASKLVEMGYPISMSNVDWYKRQLLSEAGGASQ